MARHDLTRVSVRGAGRVASRFTRAKRDLQDDLIAELLEIGEYAEIAFSDHAPEDTGHAKSSIRFIPFYRAIRPQVRVEIDATRDGFDYLRSTRFGQATDPIRPRGRRPLAVHLHGRFSPPISMSSVRAYRPTSDWVSDAMIEVDREIDRSSRTIGRRFERRILSP